MRVLIVSHPAVLTVNQLPYVELSRRGWDVHVVVPSHWRHEYADGPFAAEVHEELHGRVVPRRVAFPGAVQRHFYVGGTTALLDKIKPDVAFVEQEFFSTAAAQWTAALMRRKIPFGVQADENLHRELPRLAQIFGKHTLKHASFVAARSPAAARVVRASNSSVAIFLLPHHVPEWPLQSGPPAADAFVVGFAGRLVPEKSVETLIDAAAMMPDTKVRLFGDGPSRSSLVDRARAQGVALEVIADVRHAEMPAAYAQMDVLVLPSKTMPTWAEQFGRVLIEALWCGVPVVGSSSGEIPWVINTTGGGLIFREGDPAELRSALERLRSPTERAALAARGRANVARRFSVRAVTDQLEIALQAFGPWRD